MSKIQGYLGGDAHSGPNRSMPGSWGYRLNTSRKFNDISRVYKESFKEINYGDEIKGFDYLRRLTESKEEQSEVCIPPQDDHNTILFSEAGKTITKVVQQEAACQFLKMFYSMYMSPNNSDIKWRLGDVTGTLTHFARTPGTTKQGLMYTASNFYQTFKVNSYSPRNNRIYSFEEIYTNFWFPPFTNNGILTAKQEMSLMKWVELREKALNGDEESGSLLDTEKGQCYFDPNLMIDFRGNFTYRKVAFKPLNDNIMFLQWLFERVSGICSTYLTDWDLSIYLQEGLLAKDTSAPQWISLIHRIADDNPIKMSGIHALNFGVINACVSKLFRSNTQKWDPAEFPLSPFWMAYPAWQNRRHSQRIDTDVEGHPVAVPEFYYDAMKPEVGQDRRHPLISRIQWDDFQGAALAGWTGWQLYYWKALYCNESDGLSEADILTMNAGSGFTFAEDIIRENLYENWGVAHDGYQAPTDQELQDMNDETEDSDNGDGGDYKSGGRAAAKLMKSKSAKNGAALDAANNAALQGTFGLDDEANFNNAQGTFLGVANDSVDSAKGTGICQRTPALYGGPHGAGHSPLTVQSYLEANNTWLRNVPRIAPVLDEFQNEGYTSYGQEVASTKLGVTAKKRNENTNYINVNER